MALDKFNFEKARSLVSGNCAGYISSFEKDASGMNQEERSDSAKNESPDKFTYTLESKTDSTATISVSKPGDPKHRTILFSLKKLDNRWLIDCKQNE